jgi:hypothetical protein
MILDAELWERALASRARKRVRRRNRSALARLALVDLLARCGERVSLATVHTWSRELQGEAYLWGIAVLEGRSAGPRPWKEASK